MSFDNLLAQQRPELQVREADPGIAEVPTNEADVALGGVAAEAVSSREAVKETESNDDNEEELYAKALEDIETFLEQSKDVFGDSVKAWQNVKAAHTKPEGEKGTLTQVLPAQDQLNAGQNLKMHSSRTMRRRVERLQGSGERVLFSTAQRHGAAQALMLAADLGEVQDPIARKVALGEGLASFREDVHRTIAASPGSHAAAWGADLAAAYAAAYFADNEVTATIATFLNSREDDGGETMLAFMERLAQTAELARTGIVEFPGLLEALAANFSQYGERSLLSQITKRVVGNPAAYAHEVAKDFLESDTRLKKELQVGSQLMQLVATKILDERGLDQERFTRLFAAQWESWPVPLAAVLKAHCDVRVEEYRQSIAKALTPFIRPGRLPATGRNIEMDAGHVIKKASAGNRKSSKAGKSLAVASKGHDMEDVSPEEAEREPITRFAWLSNTGATAKQNVMRLDTQDSLDAILEQRHFKKYLETYKHVPRLAENIRAALDKLTTDPFDKTSTALWKGSVYYLEDTRKAPRHLRRFSLQDFPGVDGSSIAAKTRIAYAIVNNEGEPTLAVYGVFLKQDIEQLSGLPRRK